MAKNTLTERQQEVYDFIVRYTQEHMYPPSITDICVSCHFKSKSNVHEILRILDDKGYIKKPMHSEARAIKLYGYKLVRVEEN